jgi:hypothetical protein
MPKILPIPRESANKSSRLPPAACVCRPGNDPCKYCLAWHEMLTGIAQAAEALEALKGAQR